MVADEVTDLLMTQLRRAGHIFHTTAEREIVRQMKEQLCYVSHNAAKEESRRVLFRFRPSRGTYDAMVDSVFESFFDAQRLLMGCANIALPNNDSTGKMHSFANSF